MRIIACFASTLDGKIADKTHPRDRIGTRADWEHLLTVRNQADAILCGGETFRPHSGIRRGNQSSKIPLQCILTRSFDLPPDAALFQDSMQLRDSGHPQTGHLAVRNTDTECRDDIQTDSPVSILVFSPEPAPDVVRKQYPSHVDWITIGHDNPVPVILETLAARGVQTLLVEGGGTVMSLFLEAKAVEELYLTLCPLFLGGADDPSLVCGAGFTVAEAPRTEVLSSEWVGQELYLHLRILYP